MHRITLSLAKPMHRIIYPFFSPPFQPCYILSFTLTHSFSPIPSDILHFLTLLSLSTSLYFFLLFPFSLFNTLRPRQNGRHFPADIFKCIFLIENVCFSLKIWLKFVPMVRINIISSLVQIMAWRPPGDKPLSEPMMVYLLTYMHCSASMS